jgi:hypothetical protein
MNTDLEAGRGLTEQSDSVTLRKRVARDTLLAGDTAGTRRNLSVRLPDERHRDERMKIVLVEDSPVVRERLVAIMMTNLVSAEWRAACREGGVEFFVDKSFGDKQLAGILKGLAVHA